MKLDFLLVLLCLFLAILGCLELGRWVRIRQPRHEGGEHGSEDGFTKMDTAVFGLMGLILAFTFSNAASRFDMHRKLIVQEANAIGTAYLRIDLLSPAAQIPLRRDFRSYTDARIERYRLLAQGDSAGAQRALERAVGLQGRIWEEAVAGCHEQNFSATTSLVLSSLNDMIDITTTRAVAQETHAPVTIYLSLAALVLVCSILAGYGMSKGGGRRNWMHMLVYAAALAFTVYLIVDLDYPRLGLVRVSQTDHILVDLRGSMK